MGKTYKPIDLEKTSAPVQDFLFLIFFKSFLCIMIDHNMVCYIDKEVISETVFMRDLYQSLLVFRGCQNVVINTFIYSCKGYSEYIKSLDVSKSR